MKFIGIVLVCCALLVKAQTPGDIDPTTPPTPTTTTEPATTSATTTTTTKEPDTTTTAAPSTTSTAKPAPAPTPSPAPIPYPKNIGTWSADEKNKSCILLKGAMQIILNESKSGPINIPPPPHSNATGRCPEAGPQVITITWNSGVGEEQNSLSMTFESNTTKENSVDAASGITSGKYGLQNVEIKLYLNSTNATVENLSDLANFQTPLSHSYSCFAEEEVKSNNVTLKIRDLQIEAFRNITTASSSKMKFSASVQCPADDATDVVPIAVGAALAGLVVVVLIAYLIGRKRSRARGYQSV